MLRHLVVLCTCLVAQAQDPASQPIPPSAEPAILQSVEDKYTADVAKAEILVTKAETELTKAKQVAAGIRLKAYKDRLVEITKKGDFDKAVAVKARIEQLEKETTNDSAKASKRARPKDTVKFGGHTYALIKEPAAWHVAKQRCEDMGGHLAILETPAEAEFFATLCTTTEFTWAGATDEEIEGKWVWVNGKPLASTDWIAMDHSDEQHYLGFNRISKRWYDCNEEHRVHYVCEWER